MSYVKHRSQSEAIVARCAVLTLSDTRNVATDTSGKRIRELIETNKHAVAAQTIIRDEPAALFDTLTDWLSRPDFDAVITNGGTGISRRDQTIDVILKFIDMPLDGFGELFRMLSYAQIGSGAMISRAIGGIASGKPIFALPGSTKAVELGMTMLILPELGHILRELRR